MRDKKSGQNTRNLIVFYFCISNFFSHRRFAHPNDSENLLLGILFVSFTTIHYHFRFNLTNHVIRMTQRSTIYWHFLPTRQKFSSSNFYEMSCVFANFDMKRKYWSTIQARIILFWSPLIISISSMYSNFCLFCNQKSKFTS